VRLHLYDRKQLPGIDSYLLLYKQTRYFLLSLKSGNIPHIKCLIAYLCKK
jgi:hypothetical protein